MTDLDARVAALMSKVVNYRYVPIEVVDAKKEELEQAIRAELQKPALHEPVTDAELQNAMNAYCADEISTKHGWKVALESFLQGRAKPDPIARINITKAGWTQALVNGVCVASSYGQGEYVYDLVRKINAGALGVESAKPAQEQITDAEPIAKEIYEQWVDKPGYVQWETHGNSIMQDKARDIARACIRASKGEKA